MTATLSHADAAALWLSAADALSTARVCRPGVETARASALAAEVEAALEVARAEMAVLKADPIGTATRLANGPRIAEVATIIAALKGTVAATPAQRAWAIEKSKLDR